MRHKIDLSKIKPRKTSKPDNISVSSSICNPCVWDRFDKIYCIHYLPYTERYENIKNELKRVGILELPQFEWYYTTNNPYYKSILQDPRVDGNNVSSKNINYTIDSLNLMNICHHNKFEHVLLLEDDLKFIDDASIIEEHIAGIPSDYDFVNFDPLYMDLKDGNETYIEVHLDNMLKKHHHGILFECITKDMDVFQTSFVAMSKNMITHVVQNDFIQLKPLDHYFVDQGTSDENYKRYVSTINLGH